MNMQDAAKEKATLYSESDKIKDKRLVPFLNDYKLNLISVADIEEEDFKKFNTDLGFALQIIKHKKDFVVSKLLEKTNHKKFDSDSARFMEEAAGLSLELTIEEDGVDMCEGLEKRYKQERIEGAIDILREDGISEEEIIVRITNKYQVSREYVIALLSPKTA
ncbi:MAG: hypothetical protein IK152_06030 [Lachnospiraceae bacterium]|nr:hypothetical protein [Lachnospiraceae bacterium]